MQMPTPRMAGLELHEQKDLFLYSTVSQSAKPKKDDNNDGSSRKFLQWRRELFWIEQ